MMGDEEAFALNPQRLEKVLARAIVANGYDDSIVTNRRQASCVAQDW